MAKAKPKFGIKKSPDLLFVAMRGFLSSLTPRKRAGVPFFRTLVPVFCAAVGESCPQLGLAMGKQVDFHTKVVDFSPFLANFLQKVLYFLFLHRSTHPHCRPPHALYAIEYVHSVDF